MSGACSSNPGQLGVIGDGVPAGDSVPASVPDGSVADGSIRDDASPTALDSSTSGSSNASVNLTFSGSCHPDLTDLIVVAGSDSIGISKRYAPLDGSLQFAFTSSGTIALSSKQRSMTGDVVNLIYGTTYTNMQTDYPNPDPISGTLTINRYDRTKGLVDLRFTQVVLQNVSDQSLCTMNGTVVTTGPTF